ncbi:hypothetical protein FRC19_006442 [Serendipita sp. 401]|nr:hypothetical protein FRC15_010243 [Serendipita sp. 397]KAG8828344.1 hypothetical protein FRC19_006442 [Serendipita sp. 401]KAG9058548.1 hypothetical protein FS842_008845 [Serendipita sp. 407]
MRQFVYDHQQPTTNNRHDNDDDGQHGYGHGYHGTATAIGGNSLTRSPTIEGCSRLSLVQIYAPSSLPSPSRFILETSTTTEYNRKSQSSEPNTNTNTKKKVAHMRLQKLEALLFAISHQLQLHVVCPLIRLETLLFALSSSGSTPTRLLASCST